MCYFGRQNGGCPPNSTFTASHDSVEIRATYQHSVGAKADGRDDVSATQHPTIDIHLKSITDRRPNLGEQL